VGQLRPVAHPGDHLEAGKFRQSEVQQDEKWNRVPRAIRVVSLAGEVQDGLLSVPHLDQRIGNVRIAEGAAQQQNVRFVILDQKYGGVPELGRKSIVLETHSNSDTEYFFCVQIRTDI
jgi:hypothetical protein